MMDIHQFVAFALLFSLLVSVLALEKQAKQDDILKCIPTGEPRPNVKIRQSEYDDRQYKYLTLDNKLRIVLVSDPSVERSAAAVSVHAGYSSDPPWLPGLAHFCEHMLFMGTEKYPDESDFMNF